MTKKRFMLQLSQDLSVPVSLSSLPVEPGEIARMLQNRFRTSLLDFLRATQQENVHPWWTVSVVDERGTKAQYIIARDVIKGDSEGNIVLRDYALSVCYFHKDNAVIALVSFPAAAVDESLRPKAQVVARIAGNMIGNTFWGGVRVGGRLWTLSGMAAAVLGVILLPAFPQVAAASVAGAGISVITGVATEKIAKAQMERERTSLSSGGKELFAHPFVSRSFEPLANMIGSAFVSKDNTLYITGYHSTGDKIRGTIGVRDSGVFISGVPTGDAIDVLLKFSEMANTVWIYVPSPTQARIILCEKGKKKETPGHVPSGISQVVVREVMFHQPENTEIITVDEMGRLPSMTEGQQIL